MINQLLGGFAFKTYPHLVINKTSGLSLFPVDKTLIKNLIDCLIYKRSFQSKEDLSIVQFHEFVSNLDNELLEEVILELYAKTIGKNDPYASMLSRLTSKESLITYLTHRKEGDYVKNYKISKYYDVLIDRIRYHVSLNQIKEDKNSFNIRGINRV